MEPVVYKTHWNGAQPYEVTICGKNVTVKRKDKDKMYSIDVLSQKNCRNIYVGEDEAYPQFDGNSILLETSVPKRYIFIGHEIYFFETNDTITDYKSPIGNSDVPYPYAFGIDNTYLMLEYAYIPNFLRHCSDPYQQIYGYCYPYANKKIYDVLDNKKYNNELKIRKKISSYYEEHYPMRVRIVDSVSIRELY